MAHLGFEVTSYNVLRHALPGQHEVLEPEQAVHVLSQQAMDVRARAELALNMWQRNSSMGCASLLCNSLASIKRVGRECQRCFVLLAFAGLRRHGWRRLHGCRNDRQQDLVVQGQGDDDIYEKSAVYNFAWTLNRCTSYTFTIYDSYGDGIWSPVGYAKLMYGEIILGRIDGDFGSESSISFNICDNKSDN